MNLGQKLFSAIPQGKESKQEAALRVEETGKLFKRVFGTSDGKKLLKLLYSHSHPLAPRFAPGRSAEEVAFLDGERSLIGLLWLNGTSETTMNPDE